MFQRENASYHQENGGRIVKTKNGAGSYPPSARFFSGSVSAMALGAALALGFASPALADDECGTAAPGDTIVCDDTTYDPADGDIRYDVDGLMLNANNIQVDTTANNQAAIRILGAGANTITADAVAITTQGSTSHGLFARTTGDNDATVTQITGSIETTGFNANGILAEASGDGNATAEQSGAGSIIASGDRSNGVLAFAQGNGDAFATQSGTGSIEVDGDGSVAANNGVMAETRGTGDATATKTGSGSITTNGLFNIGVFARATGTGSAIAEMTAGTITTFGDEARGISAFAADASSQGTATAIMRDGEISTAGAEAIGVEASNNGLGSSTATMVDGLIETGGEAGHGLVAITSGTSGNGQSLAEQTGTGAIRTSGDSAWGIAVSSAGLGGAIARQTGSGSIETSGNNAHGAGVLAIGDVTVEQTGTGTITTSGEESHGIYARSVDGAVSITQSGNASIETTGDEANGIHGRSYGTSIEITASNVMAANSGVYARSDDGDITVETTGDITGTADKGIEVRSEVGSAPQRADNSINVTTAADTAVQGGNTGIAVYTFGDDLEEINITANGDVFADPVADANRPAGITAFTNGDGDINITSNGEVRSRNAGIFVRKRAASGGPFGYASNPIDPNTPNEGDISITVSGEVSAIARASDTGPNAGIAILAANDGEGDIEIALTGNASILGQSADDPSSTSGTGISARSREAGSGSGDITITTEAGTTIEARRSANDYGYAIGIYAAQNNADNGGGGGDITINTSGTIRADNVGIFANQVATADDDDPDTISITANNVYSESFGIFGLSQKLGNVEITTTGTVETQNDARGGAIGQINNAASDGDVIVIAQNGSVTTNGEIAHALQGIHNGTGDILVAVTGADVETTQDNAHGAFAQQSGTGDAEVAISGGSISTAGNAAYGMYAIASDGDTIVNLSGGSVETTGAEDSHAIVARNTGDGGITVTQGADSTINGADYGIRTNNSGGGDTVITIDGDVTGNRFSAIDAKARRSAAGDPGSMTITTTGNITGVAQFNAPTEAASGIYATNGGTGDLEITATDGTISGGWWGIQSQNWNGGDLIVNTSGAVIDSPNGSGIYARNWRGDGGGTGPAKAGYADTGSLSVTTGDVSAGGRGIFAANAGTEDLIIDSSGGTVTADGNNGVEGRTYEQSNSLTITTGEVTAGGSGIYALANGRGDATITANGDVTGADGDGIYANNSDNGTDLTIIAEGDVSGDQRGILALDEGSGTLSVTASGKVTGTESFGIYARNAGTGDNLLIDAMGDVSGNADAILARNNGEGYLTVMSAGTVTSALNNGIAAINSANGTDLTIDAQGDVSGEDNGIGADNDGTGMLSVTTTGNVSGNVGNGIIALNSADSTSLIVDAQGQVTGNLDGIRAVNYGTGDATVTTGPETITGITRDGLYARNGEDGTGLTIVTNGDVTGAGNGIAGIFSGDGDLSITSYGTVTGDTNNDGTGLGIGARNYGSGNLEVTAYGDVIAGNSGISATNDGDGELIVTTIGSVVGAANGAGLAEGIAARNYAGTNLTVNAQGDVTGTRGIGTGHQGSGVMTVTVSGNVFANGNRVDDAGILNIRASQGGDFIVTDTGSVGALTDLAFFDDAGTDFGDPSSTLTNDGTITGHVIMGLGDDTFANNSSNSFNVRDFADDQGADGIRETESVAVNDFGVGTDSFDNSATGTVRLLTVEGQPGFTADTSDDTAPTAWVTTGEYTPGPAENTGASVARSIEDAGVEQGHFTNLESFTNSGVITMQDAETGGTEAVWGDVLVITGSDTAGTDGGGIFTSNGGELRIDTFLNDGSMDMSDLLVVDSTVTGTGGATRILVDIVTGSVGSGTDVNDNGMWDVGEGILVVEVLGASATDAFTLGGIVIDNGFEYFLEHGGMNGGDWYLANTFAPDVVLVCGGSATVNNTNVSDVLGCIDNDTIILSGTTAVSGVVEGAGGSDTITITDDVSVAGIVNGGGAGQDDSAAADTGDIITVDTTGTIGGIDGELGDDEITLTNGTVTNDIVGGEGNDTLSLTGGTVGGDVTGNDGDDIITVQSGTVSGDILGSDGNDNIRVGTFGTVGDPASVAGLVSGGLGDDSITITTNSSVVGVSGGAGNDQILANGGVIDGDINGDEGDDTIRFSRRFDSNDQIISEPTLNGTAFGGEGNDLFTAVGGTINAIDGGEGDDRFVLADGFLPGTTEITGGITGGEGDDVLEWEAGQLNSFDGGEGSDIATVSADEYDGSQLLNGGDNVSAADGSIDELTLDGVTVTANGANITNWETVTLDGSELTTGDGALVVGSDDGTGLFLTNDSTVNGEDAFALTGNMTIEDGSTFTGEGAGSGIYSVSGDLDNAGAVSLADGEVGDVLTVDGTYVSNGGTLELDTLLNDGSTDMTDLLVVGATETGAGGATQILIDVAAASMGAITDINENGIYDDGEGILIVDVSDLANSANDAFTLGGIVIDNDIEYFLEFGDTSGDWFLANLAAPDDVFVCGGSATVTDTDVTDVLGCIEDDTITIDGSSTVAGRLEGAGGSDTITIAGDASVTGVVNGAGPGQDDSADADTGDIILVDTTGTIGGIDGALGDDQITLANGSVTNDVVGGEGNDTISLTGGTVGGDVTGNNGDDSITLAGAELTGAVSGDAGDDMIGLTDGSAASVAGGDGNDGITLDGAEIAGDITGDAGDDSFDWTSGLTPSFNGGDGSDVATVTASEYDGSQLLDGGDDVSVEDGFIDELTLRGVTVTANSTDITNWETVTLDDSQFTSGDGAFAVGSDAGTGLFVTNSSLVDAGSGFALTGNLSIDATSTFQGFGGGAGIYSVSGNLANGGAVTLADGVSGDMLTVAGDYAGAGSIALDFDAFTDSADTVLIEGSVTGGTTTIIGNNVTSGEATGNDILLVSVDGDTGEGDFILAGGQFLEGAFLYDLVLDDSDWLLRAGLNAATPTLNSYLDILRGMNRVPTLQQRVGNRHYANRGQSAPVRSDANGQLLGISSGPEHIQQSGVWGRIDVDREKLQPGNATAAYDSNTTRAEFQLGADFSLTGDESDDTLIAGINAHYITADSDIDAAIGGGDINTQGYGLGATLTWYGQQGFYADAQGRYTWYDSDLDSDVLGTLVNGNDADGYVLSLELGQKLQLDEGEDGQGTSGSGDSVTPQLQLTYSDVSFDTFANVNGGGVVEQFDGESLRLRAGLAIDGQRSWKTDSGKTNRRHLYGIVNLHHEFLDPGAALIGNAQTPLVAYNANWFGEFGLGGSFSANDGAIDIFAEFNVTTNLDGGNPGDFINQGVMAGIRINW